MQFISLLAYVFSLVVWCGVSGSVYTFALCYLAEGRKLFYCVDNEAVSTMKHIFVMYVQKCMTGLFLWSAEPPDHTYSLHIGTVFPILRFDLGNLNQYSRFKKACIVLKRGCGYYFIGVFYGWGLSAL